MSPVMVFMLLFNVSSLSLMFYVVGVLGLFCPLQTIQSYRTSTLRKIHHSNNNYPPHPKTESPRKVRDKISPETRPDKTSKVGKKH